MAYRPPQVNAGPAQPIASSGSAGILPNATTTPPITGNPAAVSTGTASPFGSSPFGADPKILGKLNDLVYSVPAGGYITAAEANNANSAQTKYNLQDPAANQIAKSVFEYLGSLPTVANTSAALSRFNAATGAQPSILPSIQSKQGGTPWAGPWGILPQHPSSQPRVG